MKRYLFFVKPYHESGGGIDDLEIASNDYEKSIGSLYEIIKNDVGAEIEIWDCKLGKYKSLNLNDVKYKIGSNLYDKDDFMKSINESRYRIIQPQPLFSSKEI